MSAWIGKPCQRCEAKKGPAYLTTKYCGNCVRKVRKETAKRNHRTMVARVYGMEPDDYDRLHEAQNGLCAICTRATGRTRRLSVDHDHFTGRVRGLLCRTCNDMIGHARDDIDFFMRAVAYLRFPPAKKLIYNQIPQNPEPEREPTHGPVTTLQRASASLSAGARPVPSLVGARLDERCV